MTFNEDKQKTQHRKQKDEQHRSTKKKLGVNPGAPG